MHAGIHPSETQSPMKPMLLIAVLLVSALSSLKAQNAPLTSAEDFLYAIREVETGNCYNAPTGSCGEEGAYQFKRNVWAQHTHISFDKARTHYSDTVALAHFHWIIKRLKNAHITPTITKIAAAWNCGVTAVIRGRIPHSTKDYAQRVTNLALDHFETRKAKLYVVNR